MADEAIGTLNSNVFESRFVADVCEFTRIGIWIFGVLHCSYVSWLAVTQDLEPILAFARSFVTFLKNQIAFINMIAEGFLGFAVQGVN